MFNHSPSTPLKKTPAMKYSSLPALLSSLCSVLSPQASFLILLLPLPAACYAFTSHISLQGKESTRQDDRCWEKSPAPKISHFQELMFLKGKQSYMCVWTCDTSSDLVGIISCLLCPWSGSSDVSSQQLCWAKKHMASGLTALMVWVRTCPKSVVGVHDAKSPQPPGQLGSRYKAA